jgi:class 3 adenylate cyclase/tetratricopeptide (TPR) repeat protein
MATCPSCGAENPEQAKFCMACAAPLAAPPPIPEERKVVTTLICDIVGFTAMSEAADPEDVDALLRRYNALARQVVESYGGAVEKFVGDAVVAVFGVPAVHEDDPERAARAGLKLLAVVEGLPPLAGHPIQVRVGINTGEALVRLDVTPGSGEGFLTGDAVNVAARLQSSAPPMGVVVGASTHELTSRAIIYAALEPVVAKGKREPLEAWLAKEPVARTGAQALEGASPFVGRTVELSYLTALLDKAADTSSPQVALIVGDPGIGKTRLLQELFARVEAGSRLVTWRQGRCLPYGEGVTFWALAEILKGHAGILESDDRETVEAKLELVLPEGEDRPWFRQRLRALLGLDAAKAEREENFTAWLRFLEDVASRRPTVLILEDLQWADQPLLDFLEFFALHVTHVPLMIVATARPELFEQHPSFAAAARVNRIALEPLSEEETEALVASVVEELAADHRAAIARQAQGNPFYAEESARLVRDHAQGGAKVPLLAGSVQAVIAARLDALAPELKTVVADAAVAGEVFWDGVLARVGERAPEEVASALDRLTAKQLIYRVRTSSMAGEREFAFGHSLAREVAYAELPRLVRAKKHQAVASWIEAKVGDRGDEPVEILAHHCLSALELARDAGDAPLEAELLPATIDYLIRASARVLAVDVQAAERYCSRAIALTTEAERPPELLCAWANVLLLTERHRESIAVWQEAIERLRAEGKAARAAAEMCHMTFEYETLGLPFWEVIDEAVDLVRNQDPSRELVTVLTSSLGADLHAKAKTPEEGIEGANEILAMCRDLALPVPPFALMARASARYELGDEGCMEDLQRGLEAAEAQGLAREEDTIRFNSALTIMEFKGTTASLEATLQGLETARRRGNKTFVRAYEAALVGRRYFTGDWDQALEAAEAAESRLLETEDYFDLFILQGARVMVLTSRGLADEAEPHVQWLSEHGPQAEEHWSAAMTRIASIAWHGARGEWGKVRGLLPELREHGVIYFLEFCPSVVRCALSAHDEDWARQLVNDIVPLTPLREHVHATCRALLDEADGQHEAAVSGFADAAARWHDFGVPYEEALALLGQGRCLVALGSAEEARESLSAAREIFVRLGAKPALAEIEGLLQQAAASVD